MSSQNPTTVAWWSVRMRATGTLDDEPYHVSGAESLVAPGMIEQTVAGLTQRALAPGHTVKARQVRVSLDQLDVEPTIIPALPTELKECPDPVLCRRLIPLRPPSCRSTACSHRRPNHARSCHG